MASTLKTSIGTVRFFKEYSYDDEHIVWSSYSGLSNSFAATIHAVAFKVSPF
jgi:hypothetical protein